MADFDLARDIWSTRPKPFSTFGQGVMKGALPGAATGAMFGGVGGAIAGAGLGAAFGAVAAAARHVTENMNRLEETTRRLLETYKGYSPIINRLRHQWRALDVRMNRAWAQTIAPTLKKFSDIGIEFRERWNKMKIDIFEAIKPILDGFLRSLGLASKGLLFFVEGLSKGLTKLLEGITWLLEKLGLIPGQEGKTPTRELKKFDMEWPAVEGPLTGAMKRIKLAGPPFTEEERRSVNPEEEKEKEPDEIRNKISEMFPEGLPGSFGAEPYFPGKKKKKQSDINVEVNVQDSKELSAVFEHAWRKAVYEVRKIEASETYKAFELQQQGTYT